MAAIYDEVMIRKCFSYHWPFVRGIHWSLMDSTHKGPEMWSFDFSFYLILKYELHLTNWGWVTHICISKLNTIASDNGLSPDRRQAIIWINSEILLIGPLGTNFSEILIEILTFSFRKMHLKRLSAKRRLFCLGLNELMLKYFWLPLLQSTKW